MCQKNECDMRIWPLSFPNHRYLLQKSHALVPLRFTKSGKILFDFPFSLGVIFKAIRVLKIFHWKQMFSINDGIFPSDNGKLL
jgi:hypothetical protein